MIGFMESSLRRLLLDAAASGIVFYGKNTCARMRLTEFKKTLGQLKEGIISIVGHAEQAWRRCVVVRYP